MEWFRRYLSPDDLLSLVGYALMVTLARIANPNMALAAASLLVSGMLALFWLLSKSVRERNSERAPNARVVLWAAVAAASGTLLLAQG